MVFTLKEGELAATAPPTKKTIAEGSMGNRVAKPVIEGESPIPKPNAGAMCEKCGATVAEKAVKEEPTVKATPPISKRKCGAGVPKL